jgi:hypothetical protein
VFDVEFHQSLSASGNPVSVLRHAGREADRPLEETSDVTPGYRFLPVLHLAHAAYLGWSPGTEQLLPGVFRPARAAAGPDEAAAETMIALLALPHAEVSADGEWAGLVDPELVRAVMSLAAGPSLPFTETEWVRALSGGFAALRALRAGVGTQVRVDTAHGSLHVLRS